MIKNLWGKIFQNLEIHEPCDTLVRTWSRNGRPRSDRISHIAQRNEPEGTGEGAGWAGVSAVARVGAGGLEAVKVET